MSIASAAKSDGYVAFRYRDFRLHCAARLLYGIALSMQAVAIGWYIYSVTKSPFALGVAGLSSFLPAACLSLFTGHVADTFNRRVILTLAFVTSSLASLTLFVIAYSGVDHVGAIYACVLVAGCARAFANPSAQALTPNLVPKEHFANAITWYSSAWSAARIAGPALGGILYIFGPTVPFLVAFVSIATAATCIFLIENPGPPRKSASAVTWETLSAGLNFIWSRKVILGGISLDLFAVLFGGATALLPIIAQDVMHVGPWGLGLLRSSPAIGAILMGAFLAHSPIRGGRRQENVDGGRRLWRRDDCIWVQRQSVYVDGVARDCRRLRPDQRRRAPHGRTIGNARRDARSRRRREFGVRQRRLGPWRVRVRRDGGMVGNDPGDRGRRRRDHRLRGGLGEVVSRAARS
jgi:MFS family permease